MFKRVRYHKGNILHLVEQTCCMMMRTNTKTGRDSGEEGNTISLA